MDDLTRRHFLRRTGQAAVGLGAAIAGGKLANAAPAPPTKPSAGTPVVASYDPSWISWVSSVSGCLQALGVECDNAEVAGYSGYAFLTNIAENMDVSGPTAFDWSLLLPGIHGMGRSTLTFRGGRCRCELKDDPASAPQLEAELRAAYEVVSQEVATGRPCVIWGTYLPEFGIAVGVEEGRYLVSSFRQHQGEPQPPIPYSELATPSGAYVLGFPSTLQVNREQADLNAVYHALDLLALRPSNPFWANGEAGYARWIAAMQSGRADPFGNSYNTQCWTDLKRMAREFLRRLAERNPRVSEPLGRAVTAYGEVVSALEQVAGLFVFPDAEKKVADPAVRAQAVAPLRAAQAAEAKAAQALAQAAAAWGKPAPSAAAALAPCGIDCAKCDVLARGECSGCRGDRSHQWSGDCGIRKCCVDEKRFASCGQCPDFVCQRLKDWAATWPHHAAAVERLKELVKAG